MVSQDQLVQKFAETPACAASVFPGRTFLGLLPLRIEIQILKSSHDTRAAYEIQAASKLLVDLPRLRGFIRQDLTLDEWNAYQLSKVTGR